MFTKWRGFIPLPCVRLALKSLNVSKINFFLKNHTATQHLLLLLTFSVFVLFCDTHTHTFGSRCVIIILHKSDGGARQRLTSSVGSITNALDLLSPRAHCAVTKLYSATFTRLKKNYYVSWSNVIQSGTYDRLNCVIFFLWKSPFHPLRAEAIWYCGLSPLLYIICPFFLSTWKIISCINDNGFSVCVDKC